MLGSAVTTTLTGVVVAIERQPEARSRITVVIETTARPMLKYAPDRVRLVVRDVPVSIRTGVRITGRARLLPHSGPIQQYGNDFSFHNYFRGIGATGFFFGKPRRAGVGDPPSLSPALMLERARGWLTERIKRRIGGDEGEIAAALITGAKAGIPEPINEALRRTGLAHILSISGLHMALVAGTVIVAFRLFFASFPDFASRRPVRKYAAIAALVTVLMYLFISGAGIATKRSFLMLAIMLLAIMHDRPAITMRNLAIAAIVIIMLQPHEVMGPGFQMSFAATAALVAAYGAWSARRFHQSGPQFANSEDTGKLSRVARKLLHYALALAATSLITGAATAIYGVWHFQRLAPLVLFANLAAMPVVSLLVMPTAVLAVLLIPFDLDGPMFTLMGQAIAMVVAIARWFSERTPLDNVGMIPLASVLFASIGLVVATMPVSRFKYASLPLFAFALAAAIIASPPDILISENAKMVALNRSDGQLALNTSRPSRFTLGNWLRATNSSTQLTPTRNVSPEALLHLAKPGLSNCAGGFCLARLANGALIAHVKTMADIEPACAAEATLIIVEDATGPPDPCFRRHFDRSPRPYVISGRDLALKGSASVKIKPYAGQSDASGQIRSKNR